MPPPGRVDEASAGSLGIGQSERVAPSETSPAAAALSAPGMSSRLLGIDLARALALMGMMAVHTLPPLDAALQPQPVTLLAGRAAALFAVLAGFSAELSTRRFDRWRDAAAALLLRGALILVLGLVLGSLAESLEIGIAVVLVPYGVMFALAPAVLRAPTPILAVLAPAWLIASPVLSFVIRDAAGLARAADSPTLGALGQPGELAIGVLLTGYYPVLQWFGYLLVGLLLARCDWRRARTAVVVTTTGVVVALLSWRLSQALLAHGGEAAIARGAAGRGLLDWGSPYLARHVGSYGTTPTDTWWWLAAAGPHSGTPFDLLLTSGIAAAVIGACFLTVRALGPGALQPLLAAGSLPLSLYVLHVLLSGFLGLFVLQVILLLLLASLWRATGRGQGPLERGISATVRRAVG